MDDKDFNIDDIINDVNAKKNELKTPPRDVHQDSVEDTSSDIILEDKAKDITDKTIQPVANDLHTDKESEKTDEKKAEVDDSATDESIEVPEDEVESAKDTVEPKKAPSVKSNSNAKNNSQMASKKKSSKKKNKKKKGKVNHSIFSGLILVVFILTISLIMAIGGINLGMEYLGVGKSENDVTFNIPKNSSTDDIAQILVDNDIIENKFLFKVAMKLKSPAAIYPGDITLNPALGYAGVVGRLAEMRENYKTVSLTFPEGSTLLDIANLLEENEVCSADEFLFNFNKLQGFDFENKIDDNADSFYRMEGFFFPDTYEFYVGDSGYNVTKIVREHFESKITDSMYIKMQEKNMTLSEVITLASIIQWEANSVEEMPKVASVFMNRLDDSNTFPTLQSDATKRYIDRVIDKVADNDASIEHYTDSYDTYSCKGLPAGPVCNPGIEAINAVLNPEKTDYYYFCNNLETGKSYFAKTLEEHEKNLKKAGLA